MERRGRIPVAKFRTQEAKTRSRSRVREPDYNDQDPEHDMFTLLEDNIALKEENKALKLEIEEHKRAQNNLLEDNSKMRNKLEALLQRQNDFDAQLKELKSKYAKVQSERNALDKLHKMKVESINGLSNELELLRSKPQNLNGLVIGSIELKRNLLKILPTINNSGNGNDMESILEVDAAVGGGVPITSELVERLVDEFMSLKNSMNTVELHLYEANEKMSELLENQHHLEEENETLRTENTNLTKVAKLLTENMKESVETSKKMEAALIKLKQRNDELTAKTHDIPDGQPGPLPSPNVLKDNAEFEQIKEEVQQQTRDHNERIVEVQNLMDAAIEKSTNDELKKLQLKLEILEEELRQAVQRAENAESELEKVKECHKQQKQTVLRPPTPPSLPPPPPPPMPVKLLYQAHNVGTALTAAAPGVCGAGTGSGRRSDGVVAAASDKIIDNVKQQVQAQVATGVDALVRELKSGRVTLRRNRRKTHTSDALQEMFQVLEISQKQNRNSQICIDLHL